MTNIFGDNGIVKKLYNVYNQCSAIVHSQLSLSFYSLLEAKFFKYFLGYYVDTLREFINIAMDLKLPAKVSIWSLSGRDIVDRLRKKRKILELARDIIYRYGDLIEQALDDSEYFSSYELRLIRLIRLVGSSWKKLVGSLPSIDDIGDALSSLYRSSYFHEETRLVIMFVDSVLEDVLHRIQNIIVNTVTLYNLDKTGMKLLVLYILLLL